MDDQGLENAAILLMSLGEEEAAEVFKHLAPEGSAAPGRDHRAHEERQRATGVDEVLDKFRAVAGDQSMLVATPTSTCARCCASARSATTRPTC